MAGESRKAVSVYKGVVRIGDEGSGHYLVRWTDARRKPHKRNFRRPADGRTDAQVKNAAIAFKQDRESAKRSGGVDGASFTETTTVEELTRRWLSRKKAKATTLSRDRYFVSRWVDPLLGQMRARDVTRVDVEDFVATLVEAGKAPETIRSYYGRLASLFAYAERAGVIPLTPCRNVEGVPDPGGRRKRPTVTPAQVHALADALPDEYRPVAYLAALGLRRAELFGLQVMDLDLLRSRLTVRQTVTPVQGRLVIGPPKTAKSARTIQLPANVSTFLGQHLAERGRAHDPEAYVLAAPQGGPVRPDLFRKRVWVPACIDAGLGRYVVTDRGKEYDGLGLHDLRHAAVALMREAGVPVEVASERLGHASIRTTIDIYGSLPEALDRRAADALGDLMDAGRTADRIGRKSAGGSA